MAPKARPPSANLGIARSAAATEAIAAMASAGPTIGMPDTALPASAPAVNAAEAPCFLFAVVRARIIGMAFATDAARLAPHVTHAAAEPSIAPLICMIEFVIVPITPS